MALFVVHVAKMAYCEIEIEDQPMQPSPNLIIHVQIHGGVGISIPTLTLVMQDPAGTLQNDMNLVEGIKCTITLAKDGIKDKRKSRSFRLWSLKREIMSDGPVLRVVFILDKPKYITSVYCESYRGPSSDVLQQLALKSDLQFEGPDGGTDDNMNWLNFHTTRSNFSEDICTRGYASETSCMMRVITIDGVMKYKNLNDVMTKEPTSTFAYNTPGQGKTKPIYSVRETKEMGGSGVMTHWLNYGQTQHGHSMAEEGPTIIEGVDAPVFGQALPVNEKVQSSLDAPARVNYVGLDPGTEPHKDSNVHKHYEQAKYQNVRLTALFTERIKVLINEFSDVQEFDLVEYAQKDAAGASDVDSMSLNGKYIVVGKIVAIKNGHNYSEIFDLVRPYVYAGKKGKSGGDATGATKVKANAGTSTMAADAAAARALPAQTSGTPTPVVQKSAVLPEADQLNNLMGSLVEYDKAVPAIPEVPLGGPGSLNSTSSSVVAQNNVTKAVNEVNKKDSPLKKAIAVSPDAFNPERSYTVKKISAATVESSANTTLQTVMENEGKTADSIGKKGVGLNGISLDKFNDLNVPVEKQVLDRFTLDSGKDPLAYLKTQDLTSAVSAGTGDNINLNKYVTDPLRGGVFTSEFSNPNSIPSSLSSLDKIDATRHTANAGTNFLFSASKFGLSAEDALLHPQSVVNYAEGFVDKYRDPKRVLEREGGQVYMDKFGTRMPSDASDVVDQIANKIPLLKGKFGDNEILAGNPVTTAVKSGFTNAFGGIMKLGKAVGISPSINISSYALKGIVTDGITGSKNDTSYSKIFNFRYGDSGVAPLLEKAVEKRRIYPQDSIGAVTDVIRMNRDVLSWKTLTQMGNNNSKKVAAANPTAPQPDSGNGYADTDYKQWTYPTATSIAEFDVGTGSSFSFSGSTPTK